MSRSTSPAAPSGAASVAALALILAVLAPAATAQSTASPAASPVDAVYACASLPDDAARLACYDAAVGRLKQAEETGEVTTVTRAEVEQVRRESFGFSLPSMPSFARSRLTAEGGTSTTAELDEITVSVASIRRDPHDKLIVTLADGAVWEQIDSKRITYSSRNPPAVATIKTAALGSFRMTLGRSGTFRARRVQ